LKAFVIHLVDSPKSVIDSQEIVDQLTSQGIDAQKFPGVAGNHAVTRAKQENRSLYQISIKGNLINENDRDYKKLIRPGVVGCFYSHYLLWKLCREINESIMIFEDDVKFYREWIPVEWEDVLILSLGKKSMYHEPWRTYLENPVGDPRSNHWPNHSMPGTSGYALHPHAADKLVRFYQKWWTASDNAINKNVCRIQIHNYLMGRHYFSKEGNVSFTKYKKWNQK
jgi:hypothetical protein